MPRPLQIPSRRATLRRVAAIALGLAVGQLFEMSRHPRGDQNGRYLCVTATITTEVRLNRTNTSNARAGRSTYDCHAC